MKKIYNAVSLFTGAGGMDVGFHNAGINIVKASEMNKFAVMTYKKNFPSVELIEGDINEHIEEFDDLKNIDIVFGGPPCQGFSVAGKMNPDDPRSKLIWSFLDVVEKVSPKAFVLENVKALGTLEIWKDVRDEIISRSEKLGYHCIPVILNSADFGVPQKRERVFFIGIKSAKFNLLQIHRLLQQYKEEPLSVRDTIKHLGRAGTKINPKTSNAKITFASKPIMRKSPYAGMMFNGLGRPINLDDVSNTLPASMGGNKTPIIDEDYLYNGDGDNWIFDYHQKLLEKSITPSFDEAPDRLRRLTVNEAILLQTFPTEYKFEGRNSAVYTQIGNAVPCKLAEAVARVTLDLLEIVYKNTPSNKYDLSIKHGLIENINGIISISEE